MALQDLSLLIWRWSRHSAASQLYFSAELCQSGRPTQRPLSAYRAKEAKDSWIRAVQLIPSPLRAGTVNWCKLCVCVRHTSCNQTTLSNVKGSPAPLAPAARALCLPSWAIRDFVKQSVHSGKNRANMGKSCGLAFSSFCCCCQFSNSQDLCLPCKWCNLWASWSKMMQLDSTGLWLCSGLREAQTDQRLSYRPWCFKDHNFRLGSLTTTGWILSWEPSAPLSATPPMNFDSGCKLRCQRIHSVPSVFMQVSNIALDFRLESNLRRFMWFLPWYHWTRASVLGL